MNYDKPGPVHTPQFCFVFDIDADAVNSGDRKPCVCARIETPRTFEYLPQILRTCSLVVVVLRAANYAAIGCSRGYRPLRHPRSALAVSAAAGGIPARHPLPEHM
jgi:citrate lyase beta subunit